MDHVQQETRRTLDAKERRNSLEAIALREREVRKDLGAVLLMLSDMLSERERVDGVGDSLPQIRRALRRLRDARYSLGSMRCELGMLADALETDASAQERAS